MSNYPESKRSQPSGGSRPEEHSLTREDHPGKKHQSVRQYWERQIPNNHPTSRPRIPDDSDRSGKKQRGYEDDNGGRFNPTPPRYAEEEDDYDMEDRTNEQQRGYEHGNNDRFHPPPRYVEEEDEDMEDRTNVPGYTNSDYNQQEFARSKRLQEIGKDRDYDAGGYTTFKRTFVGAEPQSSDDEEELNPSQFQNNHAKVNRALADSEPPFPNKDLLQKVNAYATAKGTTKGLKLLIQSDDDRNVLTVFLPYILNAFAVTVITDTVSTIDGLKDGFASDVDGKGIFKTYILPDKKVKPYTLAPVIVPTITKYSSEMSKKNQDVAIVKHLIMVAERQLIKSNTVLTSETTANGEKQVQVPIFEALTKRENHVVIVHDAHKVSSTWQKKIFESFDTVIFVGKVHDERGVFHMELK